MFCVDCHQLVPKLLIIGCDCDSGFVIFFLKISTCFCLTLFMLFVEHLIFALTLFLSLIFVLIATLVKNLSTCTCILACLPDIQWVV